MPTGDTSFHTEHQKTQPSSLKTALRLVWASFRCLLTEKPGQVLFSSVVLLALWGFHGRLELLQKVWPAYKGPGISIGSRPELIDGVPWDNELISFWGGFFLLVVIPCLLIKFGFKEKLSAYGLGWPAKANRGLAFAAFLLLMAVSIPAFILASRDEGMRSLYPFYKPFNSIAQFVLYELCYLPFFIAIEFIFRGYILFGLAGSVSEKPGIREDGFPARYFFSRYAVLIAVLPYTAWHLGKPLPELFGTLLWGVAAGALAYAVRSLWPVILAHWLLNVMLDGIISGLF